MGFDLFIDTAGNLKRMAMHTVDKRMIEASRMKNSCVFECFASHSYKDVLPTIVDTNELRKEVDGSYVYPVKLPYKQEYYSDCPNRFRAFVLSNSYLDAQKGYSLFLSKNGEAFEYINDAGYKRKPNYLDLRIGRLHWTLNDSALSIRFTDSTTYREFVVREIGSDRVILDETFPGSIESIVLKPAVTQSWNTR